MTGTDGPSRLATRATASMLGLHQLHQQLNYSTWATLLNKGMACTGLVIRVLKKVPGSDNVMLQQTGSDSPLHCVSNKNHEQIEDRICENESENLICMEASPTTARLP